MHPYPWRDRYDSSFLALSTTSPRRNERKPIYRDHCDRERFLQRLSEAYTVVPIRRIFRPTRAAV